MTSDGADAMLCGMTLPLGVLASCLLAIAVLSSGSADAAEPWGPIEILGSLVEPGNTARLSFVDHESFIEEVLDINVFVARGAKPGPTLCLTGAIHGDELNGVEIARSVFEKADPEHLSGTLVAIPIVNVWGFRSGNRYLPDRRDLNRAFPGSQSGSLAGRIAYVVFEHVIRRCNALIDLHTGSDERTNLPQMRADLDKPPVLDLASRFGVGVVMGGAGPEGSLRGAANAAGVHAVIYEAGGPGRFEIGEINRGIEGVTNVMEYLGLLGDAPPNPDPQRIFARTKWVRATGGGIFMTDLAPGARIRVGQRLGTVTDPMTNEKVAIDAPIDGTLVGMAYPQVVLPGFGLFHIAGLEPGEIEPAQDE